jgi:hypothetical protein
LAANASLLKPELYSNTASGPFALAAKSLAGSDLCSIADLSAGEIAALLKLAHAVKARPRDYRYALDAKQLIMFFEKASLRTRLTFETAINTLGGNAIFVDQTQSPLGESGASLPGAGGFHDARRALRHGARAQVRVCGRR